MVGLIAFPSKAFHLFVQRQVGLDVKGGSELPFQTVRAAVDWIVREAVTSSWAGPRHCRSGVGAT